MYVKSDYHQAMTSQIAPLLVHENLNKVIKCHGTLGYLFIFHLVLLFPSRTHFYILPARTHWLDDNFLMVCVSIWNTQFNFQSICIRWCHSYISFHLDQETQIKSLTEQLNEHSGSFFHVSRFVVVMSTQRARQLDINCVCERVWFMFSIDWLSLQEQREHAVLLSLRLVTRLRMPFWKYAIHHPI